MAMIFPEERVLCSMNKTAHLSALELFISLTQYAAPEQRPEQEKKAEP